MEHAVDPAPARASSAASASKSSSLFTSSSSTSGGSGSLAAARSVSRRARPKQVSTTSAPVLLRPLGDGEGDAAAREHPGDHEALALEQPRAHGASMQSTTLWPPKPNEFEMPSTGPSPAGSGRALPGT